MIVTMTPNPSLDYRGSDSVHCGRSVPGHPVGGDRQCHDRCPVRRVRRHVIAPHGGIWVVGLIGQPLLYLLAIAIGTAVTCGCLLVAKNIGRTKSADAVVASAPTQPVGA